MAYDLYVVTDEQLSHGLTHLEIAEQALAGGADVIQLRDKQRCGRDLVIIAREIRSSAKRCNALFIVNDRIDIALTSGADGVHLGREDIPLHLARELAPKPFIIGISVGSPKEAVDAEKEGADYLAVSPVFSTASKSDAGPGLGTGLVRQIREQVRIPVIAIGGIGPQNVSEVIAAGADGVAVISAVVSSADIAGSAREIKSIIARCKSERRKFL